MDVEASEDVAVPTPTPGGELCGDHEWWRDGADARTRSECSLDCRVDPERARAPRVASEGARRRAVSERGSRASVNWFEMAQTRTRTLGPAARPVAVPADVDDPALPKASGRIELPLHIRWSGPPLTYDLDNRGDRARVYEQVLREGTADDVRFYVDADRLLELWDELVLPPAVREAWTGWIERRRLAA